MSKRRSGTLRRNKRNEQLQAIYAKSRREFSAADLQKFTVMERGIPLQKVISRMQQIQRNAQPKKV
jgi:hypothetical protein